MTTTLTASPVLSATVGALASDGRNERRRTRGVATLSGAVSRVVRMIERGLAFTAVADHGGDVPNNYGYAAVTDGVIYLTVRDGNTIRVYCEADELPANKVSLGGVGALFGLRDCFDGRVGAARKSAAKAEAEAYARRRIAEGRDVLLTVTVTDECAAVMDDFTLTVEARRQAIHELHGGDVSDCYRMTNVVTLAVEAAVSDQE